MGLKDLGNMGFRNIYIKDDGYTVVGVNFILGIGNEGNLLSKLSLPFYIDFSYMDKEKLLFGMKGSLYFLNSSIYG